MLLANRNSVAVVGLHPNISADPNLLASVLSYHVLPGTFNVTPTFPNTTVGRTLLNASSDLVFLEGNKNQVLAWANESNVTTILNQKCVYLGTFRGAKTHAKY